MRAALEPFGYQIVLKEMGKKHRQTHLIDPQDIYQEVEQVEGNFERIAQKARQIDAKYPNFRNQPLEISDSSNKTGEHPTFALSKNA